MDVDRGPHPWRTRPYYHLYYHHQEFLPPLYLSASVRTEGRTRAIRWRFEMSPADVGNSIKTGVKRSGIPGNAQDEIRENPRERVAA